MQMAKANKPVKFKRGASLEAKQSRAGYVFILPWIIGVIFFFGIPAFQSLIYSFSDVKVKASGMLLNFAGFKNYHYALFSDATYIPAITTSLLNMLYEVPIIAFFSMFIAGMLNQKFRGRTVTRILFFLPVIIASGAILEILQTSGMSMDVNGTDTIYMFKTNTLETALLNAGMNYTLISYLTGIVSKIFDITWKSGIQILLYLSALQGIPSSYYEVSSLEGATAWEEFWKITFPLLTPMTLVCVIYTIIDSFTYYQNGVMRLIDTQYAALQFARSSAMSWLYFIIILIIIGLVAGVVFKNTVYTEE